MDGLPRAMTQKRYLAVAYRAADSILRSLKHLPSAFGGELMALLTLDTLWGLCLLAAGWFLGHGNLWSNRLRQWLLHLDGVRTVFRLG